MLVGYYTYEIHAASNYHKVINVQVMLQSGFSLSVKGQVNTRHNSLANLNPHTRSWSYKE